MQITLYKCSSETNQVDKTLTNATILNGSLKQGASVVNPVIFIEHENPTGFNMVNIPDFNRFYFISDIVNKRDNLWELHLTVDVLMSYKTQIKNLNVIVERAENEEDTFIDDGSRITSCKRTQQILNFPTYLNVNPKFIMCVNGGGGI